MSGAEFQTDALRPSSLPTATLGRRRHHTGGADTSAAGPGAVEDLDKVSEDWNVRIDREVKSVSSGLKDLIELADVSVCLFLLPSVPSAHNYDAFPVLLSRSES